MPEHHAALVTGGARRLGRSIVLDLAARGADVAIHYHRSAEAAAALVEDVTALGVRAVALRADLLDRTETRDLVARAASALDRSLTVLINNASIFEHDTLASATPESWDRHIGSNLRAPFELTQAFAAQAPQAGIDPGGETIARASVINMIDQRVLKPTPEFMTYTIARMGLWAFTRMAAQALAPHVRVNAIGPGPAVQAERQSDAHFAAQRSATLLGRGASLAEICAAIRYLLDAPGTTGQLICVDGGQHLGWKTPDVIGTR